MSRSWLGLVALLCAELNAASSQAQELLADVDPALVERLKEYNWGGLQETLYSASRYRVVSTNGDLLLSDDPISITVFPDVEPFAVVPDRICRWENSVAWGGLIRLDPSTQNAIDNAIANTPELRNFPSLRPRFVANIHMLRWTVDQTGLASMSRGTRPVSSGDCEDVSQNLSRVVGIGGPTSGLGQQPSSEDTERKGFRESRQGEFVSVSVGPLQLPGGKKYLVQPLPYTPKYSLVIEVDEGKLPRMPIDGGLDRLTDAEKKRLRNYQERMSELRRLEVQKPILADLE